MKCRYYGSCGGCFYSVKYEEQLAEKKEKLREIFKEDVEVVKSPVIKGYRNKMDFVYALGGIGMRERGNYKKVIDIEHCNLISRNMNKVFKKARKLVEEHGIEGYNYIKHKGYLRYISIREGKFTGDLMVNFITANRVPHIVPVAEKLKEDAHVTWSVNKEISDVNFGDFYQAFGSDTIMEKLGNIYYKIAPNSFFQSNSYIAEKIFNDIKSFVSGEGLDLYCGLGSISLFIADKCEHVTGTEANEEAIRLANENSEINNIKNVTFYAEETRKFLMREYNVDFIITDPPRSGMGKKVCRKILRTGANRLIFMSCNPKTLIEDLEWFKEDYEIIFIRGYDMFPNTNHVEVLCVLEKKN